MRKRRKGGGGVVGPTNWIGGTVFLGVYLQVRTVVNSKNTPFLLVRWHTTFTITYLANKAQHELIMQ